MAHLIPLAKGMVLNSMLHPHPYITSLPTLYTLTPEGWSGKRAVSEECLLIIVSGHSLPLRSPRNKPALLIYSSWYTFHFSDADTVSPSNFPHHSRTITILVCLTIFEMLTLIYYRRLELLGNFGRRKW